LTQAAPQDDLLALENYLKPLERYESALSGFKHLLPQDRGKANAIRDELAGLQPSIEQIIGQAAMGAIGSVSSTDPLLAGVVLARIKKSKAAVRFKMQHLQTPDESLQPSLNPATLLYTLQFHPRIIETAGDLYTGGHYSQAIFEAFKSVSNEVKRRTGQASDGQQLIATAFGGDDPPLEINSLNSTSDVDEQAGFKLISMGAMTGIRNPKAHDNIQNTDAGRPLEYLALASLLMKRVDKARLRTQPKRRRDE
jgi:uncharacterized protein (TIGR02391 family)